MNQSLSAYAQQQRNTETGRAAEARALLSCASRMESVRDPSTSREELEEALKLNQKLWTIFQATLCEADNPLSRELRTTLLNLSIYVDKTTFQILAENNRRLLESLVNINRMIAKGLSVDNETPATKPAAPEAMEHMPISTSA